MSKRKTWLEEHVGLDLAKALFTVKVTLPGSRRVIERDFTTELNIDYDELEDQLQDMPSMYAFWSAVLANQKLNAAVAERTVKRRRGKIAEELNFGGKPEDRGKLRASDIKEMIEADENLAELEAKWLQHERTVSLLFGIVRALEIKGDNLRSLAGFKRAEMK